MKTAILLWIVAIGFMTAGLMCAAGAPQHSDAIVFWVMYFAALTGITLAALVGFEAVIETRRVMRLRRIDRGR